MYKSTQMGAVINFLIEELFSAEFKRLRKREYQLVGENRNLSPQKFDGFFYGGYYYTDLDKSIASKGLKSGLHPSLVPSVEAQVADRKEVEFDRLRIRQALALSLKDAKNTQDLRDALPNQLSEMIIHLRGIERCRPEAFTLMAYPRKHQQYLKLRDKIEFYAAARLLY